MKLGELLTNVPDSMADVNVITWNEEAITLQSDDRMALAIAVCVAVNNGCGFVEGGDDWAILSNVR